MTDNADDHIGPILRQYTSKKIVGFVPYAMRVAGLWYMSEDEGSA
jgi:hypothetical protein